MNDFRQREQPFIPLCPTKPAAFLVAGISDEKQSNTPRMNILPYDVSNYTPEYSFKGSVTNGPR